ncbi:hypothetical protein ACOTI9_20660 [Achromobacter mucicolens]|uniref:hypothetical protein n=1 Tax=Achromobacter mucicolens TaxID=1389922 RepID=UPI0021D20E1D|nr:hypothetical protein [Achromobacter mucicolens]MCU6618605.1 hypothetical protein [Achromobacter mucicolens]
MNKNNTPQPVLTIDEIRSIWVEHGLDNEAVEDFARAVESALLSKLSAPVAVDLVHRLRCKYAMGPMIDGEPEFGWRDCSGPAPEGMRLPSPIMLEAAAAIERLAAQLRECADTLGADQIDEQRAMRAYADSMALLKEKPHL